MDNSTADSEVKTETGYVLSIEVTEYPTLRKADRTRVQAELKDVVRGTAYFQVADVGNKLVVLHGFDGMTLVFFNDAEAPMKCATEIAAAVKNHRDLKLRMGIHTGPVERKSDENGSPTAIGETIEMAQRVMRCGDAGHILLSRRAAYEVANSPRWSDDLYELDEYEATDGQQIPLVLFYNDSVGNRELPAKLQEKPKEIVVPEEKEERPKFIRALITAAAVIVLAAVTIAIFVFTRHPSPLGREPSSTATASPETQIEPEMDKSIVVLPFQDLSPGKDQEYFSDGVSEDIINMLSRIDGLRVIGRTSAFSFKRKNAEPFEIGQRLNVATILQGSLRREGTALRVTVQLIEARDSREHWSKTFEGDVQQVFAIQDEIRQAVINVFKLKTVTPPSPAIQDVLAYDLYLQGLYLSNKSSEDDLRSSIDFFRLALDKDKNLSRAWTGIAKNWMRRADAFVRPLDAYPQAQLAASNALAIDDQDAEAHVYLGETKRVLGYDVKAEEEELRRALQANPNSVVAHLFTALFKLFTGDAEAGHTEIEKAVALNPLSPGIGSWEVNINVAQGQFDEAFASVKRTMEVDPNYVYFESALALVYREQGKLNEALDIYLRLQKNRHQVTAALALTYAKLGQREDAERVLENLIRIANTKYFPAEQIASVYVALGDNEKAFRWLERAITEHSGPIHQIGFAREFRPLRGDPRFTDMLQRIGLDPAKFPPEK